MRRLLPFAVLIGVLFVTLAATGQHSSSPVVLDHLDSNDGLSHNTVLSIVQDRRGFMWFGTADGLNRYDGYEFVVYRHDPQDSTTLSHNTIRALLEDEKGRLWVATEVGLDRFDRSNGTFSRYSLPGHILGHKPGIHGLAAGPDGTIWIGEDESVAHLDPRGRQVSRSFLTGSLSDNPTLSLRKPVLDRSGTALWVGTTVKGDVLPAAVLKFVPRDGTLQRFPIEGSDLVDVDTSRSGGVWAVGPAQLVRVNDGAVERIATLDITATVVHEDGMGRVWIFGEKGWKLYDATSGLLRTISLPAGADNWLARQVMAVHEDGTGAIWIGTLAGIFRYDPNRKPFVHIPVEGAVIMALHEDAAGGLWIGTLGRGLLHLDRRSGALTEYRRRMGDPSSLCHDNVWSIQPDIHGTLWIGTDGGLCSFDPATGRFESAPIPTDHDRFVYAMEPHPNGHVWVGGRDLYLLDPKARTAELKVSGEPIGTNIQDIHRGESGVLWLGLEFFGLFRYDPSGRSIHYPYSDTDGLLGKAVRSIHEDANGILWLGTDMGLARFDPATEKFHHYLQDDGLPGSTVYAVLEDDAGMLWLTTNGGLGRFDPAAGTFERYDVGDGIGVLEYNRRAVAATASGEILIGGLNGITAFDPDRISKNRVRPPIVLTGIATSSRAGTVLLNPDRYSQLVLNPGDLSVSFEFAALSYTRPERNRYAYMLEGLDPAWVDAGSRRFARYVGIPPGSYVFRVKGSNNDGTWSEAGLAFPVTVRPALWQTSWFRAGAAMVLLGLLVGFYRYRMAHVLKLERLRMRIAGDLHDDIGSKLGGIALMSEMVSDRSDLRERELRQLEEIAGTSRRMAHDLRDIVWLVNPNYDRLSNLIDKLRRTADTMLNGVDYMIEDVQGDFADRLDMESRRHIFLAYKEALHNVIRHADASRVSIRMWKEEGSFVIQVSDDGRGFDPKCVEPGEGLRNIRSRAEYAGGSAWISSSNGEGTTVQIQVKLT